MCGGSTELRPKLGTTCSDSDAGFCRMTGSRWLPVMLQKSASKSEQVATHDQHFSGLASPWPLCGGSAELRPKLGTTCWDSDAGFCSMTGSHVTVQNLEEGNPIEVGVMPTSIKVVNT